jgi:hypothetical protein
LLQSSETTLYVPYPEMGNHSAYQRSTLESYGATAAAVVATGVELKKTVSLLRS